MEKGRDELIKRIKELEFDKGALRRLVEAKENSYHDLLKINHDDNPQVFYEHPVFWIGLTVLMATISIYHFDIFDYMCQP